MKVKKIVIHINELIEQENISLRELGRQADVQISALSPLASGKKQRIDLGHLKRIAEALDINDMNEIISIEDDEEDA
ncbi:putative Xre family DNA-binding protein [Tetragenococcus halophilus subsp. halophilus]|uniref:Xre family DNA-binding protein n=1 Tax=Tetragenococcus halophilus (strain DSM 20338 / JCM 20259 / NCIMB 9735 / NBRC 12172) TaxID=945021 RepID=A0AAN1SFY1_TETHN|nr:helix-turn-helix transcriptional regulator [Tetragenococcus halophilus]AOF48369.1 transcriptional regulator [Tetragenococcus halophilus]MCO7027415.1 helix-turn-helix transcriptional regulator [Tetragenococcus halophilus]MCO8284418.1 helix-turn-helix transcriptional regulator [Tetragenococcus halophilus]MCO8287473.1 helix-turn-helix transcriptional regulator [Tetragenococcus halophilus]MCO8289320.1 helix-turn-helix transcriptional regulator [Tetragenococcus halophilus]